MGKCEYIDEPLAYATARDVPSSSPSHGAISGAHVVLYNTHTYVLKLSCPIHILTQQAVARWLDDITTGGASGYWW